jgi:phosphinothricin acetyltransferase
MTAEHWPAVAAIYQSGIDTGQATFETRPPSWMEFDAAKLDHPRLVARTGGPDREDTERVVGWVAVSPVSPRTVYAGVVEHSVFVDPAYQGRGIGGMLLAALIAQTEAAGIWTIQAHVFPENTASLRLHARHGFRQVGIRRALGRMAARDDGAAVWRDVVLIERRSTTVGPAR